jgi:hypothetical protein
MTPDVRCAARVTMAAAHRPGSASGNHSAGNQCQLYVGHDGEHALLATRGQERTLLRWTGAEAPSAAPFGVDVPAQLPWAPGQPQLVVPTGSRPDGSVLRSVVTHARLGIA